MSMRKRAAYVCLLRLWAVPAMAALYRPGALPRPVRFLIAVQGGGNNPRQATTRVLAADDNNRASSVAFKHAQHMATTIANLRGGTSAVATTSTPLATTVHHLHHNADDAAHKLANLTQRAGPAVALLAGLLGIVKVFGKAGLSALVLVLSLGLYHEMVSVVLVNGDGTVNDKNSKEQQQSATATSTDATSTAALAVNMTLSGNETISAATLNAASNSGSAQIAPVGTSIVVSPSPPQTASVKPSATPRISNQWWWFLAMSLPTTLSRYLDQRVNVANLRLLSYGMMVAGWMAWIVQLNIATAPADFRQAFREIVVYHVAGLFSIVPVYCWMATLSEFATGQSWVLYAAMLVILNDTMAYLFGVSLGKHALLPVISPKKTWEGWLGALVSTTLLSYFVWKVFFPIAYGRDSLAIALFCSLVAPLGGFLASVVKRAYHIKDFSNLIAGHGGLVDRLDCQLITAPFVYLLLNSLEPTDLLAEQFSILQAHNIVPNSG